MSSKEAFARQIAYFSRFYRVTAIDFLGFGKSKPLDAPFSVGDYAAWLNEVTFLLRLQKPSVVAHSFGCRVAIKAAAQDNSLFNKLILTGAAGVILRRGFGYHMKVGAYRLVKRFAPTFAERKFGSAEYRTLSPLMKESYKKIVNEDLRTCAKRVRNAVCIVEGTDDTVTTEQEAEIYASCLARCELKRIQGGHFAFAENPLAFNLIAEEFLYDRNDGTIRGGFY